MRSWYRLKIGNIKTPCAASPATAINHRIAPNASSTLLAATAGRLADAPVGPRIDWKRPLPTRPTTKPPRQTAPTTLALVRDVSLKADAARARRVRPAPRL